MEQYCQNKIAIVGAGPSGIYCAIHILHKFKELSYDNFTLDIIDKSKILKTLLPTGGGRCNITNAQEDMNEFISNYPRGNKFLYSILSKHNNLDSIQFFNSIGIKTYSDEQNRVYPITNSSADVRNILIKELKKFKNINYIEKTVNDKNELKNYSHVVIATGSRNSEKLIKSFNHSIIPFKKSLVGLVIKNNIYPRGVSVKSPDGEFIFTDRGVSGPLILKLSSINAYKNFPYELNIKLFNIQELSDLIKQNPKKSLGTLVSYLIPKSLAKVILADDFDKKAAEISKKYLEIISELNLIVNTTEKTGEIVNAGGVNLDEITNYCKSKLNNNLWFCGEILNIDGFCGGFNLQNCWSTGYAAAIDIVKEITKN